MASRDARSISDALRARLDIEQTPKARTSLVLAVAELGREHHLPDIPGWTRALWVDPTRPADVRVPAALAWLCLVPDPVPGDLRATLTGLVTEDLAEVLDDVLWIAHIDDKGLDRTLDQMLNDTEPGFPWVDPWD